MDWLEEINLALVCLVLQGKPVVPNHTVTVSKKLYHINSLITEGILLNMQVNKTDIKAIIPHLSPLALRYYVRNPHLEGDVKQAANCLYEMLNVENNFHPLLYESFHV
jgi:hypothetical protein